MATSTAAHVTPAVLRWARESLGYTLDEAASRIKVPTVRLDAAERGDGLLTMRQAEKAARVYDRPLAALFLPGPPAEEPQEAQFRRLPGAPEPPWPPGMQSLVRRVRGRQEAAAELYDLLDEEPPWIETKQELGANVDWLARTARQLLGTTFDEQASWRDPTGYKPLRHWIDAVENLGIFVMQDGSLPVEVIRGFASTHPTVPAIVVNTQDDARARAFTAIHELGHLALEASGEPNGPGTEPWCDTFAAAVLMPPESLERDFANIRDGDPLDRIDEAALTFGVTPLAAAVTTKRRGLLQSRDADAAIARIRDRGGRARGSGGDYYWSQIGRLGPSFTRLVLTALDDQALTYPVASGLLNVKVNHFEKLREYIERRSDIG